MFAPGSQENYFRYMRQEYDVGKIVQYVVDELDKNLRRDFTKEDFGWIVNPPPGYRD